MDNEIKSSPSDPTISKTFHNQNVVELEWKAIYDDHSFLTQFEGEGENRKEHRYQDINRERLVRFDMINPKTNKAVFALYLRDGQQLIFRRRTLKKILVPDTVIFLVGYQLRIMAGAGPLTQVVINYIHPDGSIALDGARSNLELYDFEY